MSLSSGLPVMSAKQYILPGVSSDAMALSAITLQIGVHRQLGYNKNNTIMNTENHQPEGILEYEGLSRGILGVGEPHDDGGERATMPHRATYYCSVGILFLYFESCKGSRSDR